MSDDIRELEGVITQAAAWRWLRFPSRNSVQWMLKEGFLTPVTTRDKQVMVALDDRFYAALARREGVLGVTLPEPDWTEIKRQHERRGPKFRKQKAQA